MSDDRSGAYGAFGTPATTGSRERADSRAVFGQTMGLVALTVGFAALGAYLGRDLSRGAFIVAFVLALGCVIGVQAAAARHNERLAITLLFVVGLALGATAGPAVAYYLDAKPAAVYQAAGSTGLFISAFGAYGYATRRDLSSWARGLFWALLGLIVLGVVLLFVSIPGGQLVFSILGLGIFGAFTIFDFNRLRRSGMESAAPIAASIFLDVFNVFLFFLSIFGGGGRR